MKMKAIERGSGSGGAAGGGDGGGSDRSRVTEAEGFLPIFLNLKF
jgi:hypothetical protein